VSAVRRVRARARERPGRRAHRRGGARHARVLSMARAFVLPDLGEGLTEAEIVSVLVHEGDVIREDAPLLEVETDKAQVEIPSPMSGRVEKIHVQPGQTVKVGAVLISFADSTDGGTVRAAPVPPAAAAPATEAR